MDCTCPHCANHQTQRLAMIYARGTLRVHGRLLQTAASHFAAPPKPMTYLGPSIVIFLAFLILGDLALVNLPRHSWLASGAFANALQAAFLFVPVFLWLVLARRYNATRWRERLGQWERSFQCSRCGEVFLIPTGRLSG